ncbi:hypothetical protein KAI78_04660 [bacterium]|nr:hypothetical protein [bacterium]
MKKLTLLFSVLALALSIFAVLNSYYLYNSTTVYKALYKSAGWEMARGYHNKVIIPQLKDQSIDKNKYLSYLQHLETLISYDPENFLLYQLYFEKALEGNKYVEELRRNRKEKDASIARKMVKHVNKEILTIDGMMTYTWLLDKYVKYYNIKREQ